MITGAIFDRDGLLFDTETIYQRIWAELADEYGVSLDGNFTRRISGSSGAAAAEIMKEYYTVGDAGVIAKKCGARMLELSAEHIDVMPGVPEILAFLKSQRIKIAVASGSSTEQIAQNLKTTGLSDFFDAMVGGTELKYGKPMPNIFLYAAEKIQCDSHDCFVFEDSPNGIIAAHAAEAHPIMIPNLMEATDELRAISDGVYPSMHEALEAIRSNPEHFQ